MTQIRGAVAEYERTLIADRMRRGRLAKMKAGQLLPWTSQIPYGYRVSAERPRDPALVEVDAYAASIVQEIFAAYAEGRATLHSLAEALTRRGVPTPRGLRVWSPATLHGILTNPAYIGQAVGQRYRTRTPDRRHSPLLPDRANTRTPLITRPSARGVDHRADPGHRARVLDAYLAGAIDLPTFDKRRQGLTDRDAELAAREGEILAQGQRLLDTAALLHSMTDVCTRLRQNLDGASFTRRRELVELLIDRVIVIDADVEIRYVVPTSEPSLPTRFCQLRQDYHANPAPGVPGALPRTPQPA